MALVWLPSMETAAIEQVRFLFILVIHIGWVVLSLFLSFEYISYSRAAASCYEAMMEHWGGQYDLYMQILQKNAEWWNWVSAGFIYTGTEEAG